MNISNKVKSRICWTVIGLILAALVFFVVFTIASI